MRVNMKSIALVINVFGMPSETHFAVRLRQEINGQEHVSLMEDLDLEDVIIMIEEIDRVWEEEYVAVHQDGNDIDPVS